MSPFPLKESDMIRIALALIPVALVGCAARRSYRSPCTGRSPTARYLKLSAA